MSDSDHAPNKTPEVLDDMIEHISYEVRMLINFLAIGNGWTKGIEGLPDGWADFTSQNMLEAALIHARCIAEFLRRNDDPDHTVTARDYVSRWHWVKGEPLKKDLSQIHGRVAHLGLIRCTVQGRDFSWETYLKSTAVPTLLDGFREFLGRLDADRRERFNQPRPTIPHLDLVATIGKAIGASAQ